VSQRGQFNNTTREVAVKKTEKKAVKSEKVESKKGSVTKAAAKEQKKLESGPMVQQCSVNDINIFEQSFECARGFAYGLQFSPMKEGVCYIAVDQAINAAETVKNLLTQFYIPSNWADIIRISNSYVSFVASINSNCNVQKLINTLTTNPTTLLPAAVSRIGGGFILEIPNTYKKMKQSSTAFGVSRNFAKIFSLVCDYYI
jgi:xanthine dehydrogenase molybdopterin-binding subunit B